MPCQHKGPPRYLVKVLQQLLQRHQTAREISAATGLDLRTVRAQITALRTAEAVRVVHRSRTGQRAGTWAVYAAVVHSL